MKIRWSGKQVLNNIDSLPDAIHSDPLLIQPFPGPSLGRSTWCIFPFLTEEINYFHGYELSDLTQVSTSLMKRLYY